MKTRLYVLLPLLFYLGSASAQTLCNVEPGSGDAQPKIQHCILSAPYGGTVLLKPGVYKLGKRLQIFQPVKLRTQGFSPDNDYICKVLDPLCAVLSANLSFDDSPGLMHVQSSNVMIDHIAFDGNRREKNGCTAKNWQKGILLAMEGDNVGVHGSSFYDGRCGAAIEVRIIGGRQPTGISITHNRIVRQRVSDVTI